MPILLHTVYDSRGVIIAASRHDPEDDKSAPAPIPQAGEGNYYALIPLDEAHVKMPLDQLCTTTRVDSQHKRLIAHDLHSQA
ncbi:hypothetical protein MESS2_290004 [Mesorhizobium metallidurans STM 2683]|uniref:Uncharacterized protein n=1 Tax=Mesorhizobium metallidurans STM 2683 TaxID=1297569 RepID=M5EPX5_9HYPH|nr:hypothetical protein MESS2_290004 [Mesorhizobium metallidurans STM 2683]